jgi:hypothetical protein
MVEKCVPVNIGSPNGGNGGDDGGIDKTYLYIIGGSIAAVAIGAVAYVLISRRGGGGEASSYRYTGRR